VMGHLPTGVSVAAAAAADGPAGLVVGSFMSVSLEPPLIAISPALSSNSWPAIREAGHFCVNVLSERQENLARRFATSGGDKFAGVDWRPARSGSPVLTGAVTWIDCRLYSEEVAGDHWLVLGEVLELDIESGHGPLIFHRGTFERMRPVS
ncbi:MAG TPA: flavin reductase family protein, partial [Solirubrobacterales bacterium]